MKIAAPLVLLALGLAACAQTPPTDPDAIRTGGSAGSQTPGYCDTPPKQATDLEQWNELCMPGRRG